MVKDVNVEKDKKQRGPELWCEPPTPIALFLAPVLSGRRSFVFTIMVVVVVIYVVVAHEWPVAPWRRE